MVIAILPARPMWPTLANMIHKMCLFIQRHQKVLMDVLIFSDPSAEADVIAAFAALNSACSLFIAVMSHVDPNWKPS